MKGPGVNAAVDRETPTPFSQRVAVSRGDQNAKDACHDSLLGADCSAVNPGDRCSGTPSCPQGKP
jgi:hypothetical protein